MMIQRIARKIQSSKIRLIVSSEASMDRRCETAAGSVMAFWTDEGKALIIRWIAYFVNYKSCLIQDEPEAAACF